MNSFGNAVLIFATIFVVQPSATTINSEPSTNLFAKQLLSIISKGKLEQNVVFSPIGAYACLASIFLGAGGDTESEMRTALKINEKSKSEFAEKYGRFLNASFEKTTYSANGTKLIMAKRVYVNKRIKILSKYRQNLQNLGFDVQSLNFSVIEKAAAAINKWVFKKTNKKMKNLLRSKAINIYTSAVMVNAVYFKAHWLHPFIMPDSLKMLFRISKNKTVNVDTMTAEGSFRFAYLSEINARAIEIPYANSKISMLIISPTNMENIKEFAQKIEQINLSNINDRMEESNMRIFLPKFRIKFSVGFKEPLSNMGFKSIFTRQANFTEMFDSSCLHDISVFKQKAILEVDEAGSEAAAATYSLASTRSDIPLILFDRPFIFFVRSELAIYFTGYVAYF